MGRAFPEGTLPHPLIRGPTDEGKSPSFRSFIPDPQHPSMAQAKNPARKSKRIDFGSLHLPAQYPDFLDIQLKSFQELFKIETLTKHRNNQWLYKVFV